MGGIVLGVLVWQEGGEAVGLLIAIGVASLATLAWWLQKRKREGKPVLIDPVLFASKIFRLGITGQMMQQISLGGMMIALPIFLQMVLEYNALQAGLSLAPLSLSMFFVAILAGRAGGQPATRQHHSSGLRRSLSSGSRSCCPIVPRADSGWWMAIPLAIAGSGLGLLVSQLNNYTLGPIEEERISEAAGVNSAGGSFGLSFGLAVAGAVMLATLAFSFTNLAESSEVFSPEEAQQVATALDEDAQLMSNTGLEEAIVGQPPDVEAEIIRINTEARPISLQVALLVPLIAGLIGLVQLVPDDSSARREAEGRSRGLQPGLTAHPISSDDPAGVEDPERVERDLDRAHDGHGVGSPLLLQELPPGGADAVLAGDRTAEADRGAVELLRRGVSALLGVGVAAIPDEGRVQVAVPGVAERAAPNVVRGGDALDRAPGAPGRGREARRRPPSAPRPAARGRGTPSGGPGAASRPPPGRSPGPPRSAPASVQAVGGSRQLIGRGRPGPVRLDEQERGGGPIQPEVVPLVDGGDRHRVHQLERARLDARGGHAGDGLRRPRRCREEREHRLLRRRCGSQAQRRLGDDPERSLRARRRDGSASSRRRPSRSFRRSG